MTNEKTPTLEKLEAALRHYSSYGAAIQSVKDQREEHVWKIKNTLRKYLIDEQILKDMVFEVGEYRDKTELTHDAPEIPLVDMLEEHFQFNAWYLMSFKRPDSEAGYEHVTVKINQYGITITLLDDMSKEEIKQLKEKFGFTIDTCSYTDNICQAKDRIKYFEEKLDLYG